MSAFGSVLRKLLLASVLVAACGGGSGPTDGGLDAAGGGSDLVDDRMSASPADAAGARVDGDGPDASPPDAPADDAHDAPFDVTVDVREASEAAGDTTGAGQDAAEAGACVPRRCGHEIACGVAADGCGDSVTCDPCPDVGRALRLAGARHMVVDKTRGLIYVTMPASHPTYPNTVLVVAPTPTTPKVMSSVPVGSEPNVIALSDDGSRLWVGTDGDNAIRKVELGSGAPVLGPQYKLPFGFNYPYPTRAAAMKVLQGNADSVIVSLANSTEIMGIVVIDDGLPRTAAMRANASCLTVGRNNDVFGADGMTTAYDFFDLQVSAQGVTPVLFPKLLTEFTHDLVFDHDRVYSEGADVVDVSNPSAPVHIGKLPTFGSPRPLPADATRVLLLGGGPLNGDAILRMVDASTFAVKATVSIAGVTGYFMRDMDLLGSDSIAFIAEELVPNDIPNRVVVARTSLLP